MPTLQGTITIDGTNYVVPTISDVLEIRSDGVYNMTSAAYVWQSQSAIAGLSTTQGATAPDSDMAVGDTLQGWDAMSFYSVAAQAITNLTGTRWVFSTFDFATYEPTAYSINGNFLGTSFDLPTFKGIKVKIGGDLQFNCDPFMSGDSSYRDIANFTTPPLMIEITAGNDVTDADLIAWLAANATQVQVSDLTGTKWVINNSPDELTLGGPYSINLTSNQQTFDEFRFRSNQDALAYGAGGNMTNIYVQGDWVDKAYRIMRITGGTDATNAALIVWLTQNATLLPSSLAGTKWTIGTNVITNQLGQYSINFSSNSERFSFFNLQAGGILYDSTQVYYYSGGND